MKHSSEIDYFSIEIMRLSEHRQPSPIVSQIERRQAKNGMHGRFGVCRGVIGGALVDILSDISVTRQIDRNAGEPTCDSKSHFSQ
ncbi:hypothetical protein [Paraburkholderia sp. J67]|uniref:hypothetical protein n=1 Tax=Paraburkholderia sp. J67 TaxID=2805435 RepID=UPI002ABE0F40|nr:hypothetical protein [Paraburkholderia sp. J67]